MSFDRQGHLAQPPTRISSDRQGDLAQPQTRINLRPLASPLPLGLYSFGIGMLLLGAQSAGWIPVKEDLQVGLVLASFVFPLEGVAAIFAFLARDTLAATVLGLFATSWLTVGLALIVGPPGTSSIALGFYLFAFAAAVIALSAVAVRGKPLIALVLMLSATRAILDGIYEVSGSLGIEAGFGLCRVGDRGAGLVRGHRVCARGPPPELADTCVPKGRRRDGDGRGAVRPSPPRSR